MNKVTLDNGVRIVTEHLSHVRTTAFGIWVGNGSRHEPRELAGISHAIEHMLFKGTESRSAVDIAELNDRLGGQINAFTTKSCTCYYGRTLDSDMRQGIDLLADMFFNSRLDEEDWRVERNVIREEINMCEDNPEDLVGERLYAAVYKGSSLSRPILGYQSSLSKIKASTLRSYMAENYSLDRIIISVAGNFDDTGYIVDRFSRMCASKPQNVGETIYTPAFTLKRKPTEQTHILIAFPALPYGHPDRFAQHTACGILGSGMSSRLYQTVREKYGLCYSIYSYVASHEDSGLFFVYLALSPEQESDALKLVSELLRDYAANGPTEEELTRAIGQIKANVMMSLESTNARMHHMGNSELTLGRVLSMDDIIAGYEALTLDDVKRVSTSLLNFGQVSFSAVGGVKSNADAYRRLLGVL